MTDAEVLVLVLWFQALSEGLTPAVTSLPVGVSRTGSRVRRSAAGSRP